MKFLDSFRKLFSKKEPEIIRVEKVKKVTRENLNAKIKADIKKSKDFEKEEKEKDMRELIEKKRKEREAKEIAAKAYTKKKLKTLSTNF